VNRELLKTLVKFSSLTNAANVIAGSPAYTMGAGGDVSDVPASEVVKNSILPNLGRIAIGSGLGYAVGYTVPHLMEDAGILGTQDNPGMVGNNTSTALRWAIPAASTAVGGTIAQSMGRKKDFVQGIRDRSSAI
jgi:hypothetical protein